MKDLRVGSLPTMNQDEYPSLPGWWVQIWDSNGNTVVARVYGDSPAEARERALAFVAALEGAAP